MERAIAPIAATSSETARARMLYSLMDNHARTSTELAVIADVTPSTASVHLQRLKSENLVQVLAQGKHRYYSPRRLCEARTCYDHIAGTLGVLLHDRLEALGVISAQRDGGNGYDVTATGVTVLDTLGIDLEAARTPRRRLAFACLD